MNCFDQIGFSRTIRPNKDIQWAQLQILAFRTEREKISQLEFFNQHCQNLQTSSNAITWDQRYSMQPNLARVLMEKFRFANHRSQAGLQHSEGPAVRLGTGSGNGLIFPGGVPVLILRATEPCIGMPARSDI